jgi:hypothetical protein
MESQGPTASSSIDSTTTIGVTAFSKTIALTYLGWGFFCLIFLMTGFYDLDRAVVMAKFPLMIPSALLLSLAIGFIYLILALHRRRNWARYAAVSFWLLCLVWTGYTIVRNGLHPEPPPGPLRYSNTAQLAGARKSALLTPYLMAILESTVADCLLQKVSVVNQFKKPDQTRLDS